MIPFKFNKKSLIDKQKIVNEYYKLVVNNRSKSKLKDIESWCTSNLKIGSKIYTFKDVITAEFSELCTIQEHLYKAKPSLSGLYKIKKSKSGKLYNKYYIKDTLYGNMPKDARNKILDNLELTVCPYCNRNYINPAGDKITCHLDHFYNKNDYPILAVSFYNLIPVCPACNATKGIGDCSYSPYDSKYKTNDLLEFKYILTDTDYLSNKNSIKISIAESAKMTGNKSTLHLEDLYKLHTDVVQEILVKADMLNGYSKALIASFGPSIKSEKELARMLLGNYVDEDDFGKRPLSKMMRDVAIKAKLLK